VQPQSLQSLRKLAATRGREAVARKLAIEGEPMSSGVPTDTSILSVNQVLPVDGPLPEMQTRSRHVTTLLVTEGIVYLAVEDDEQVLTPGDLATIPAGAAHRFFNAGDGDAEIAATYERVPAAGDRQPLAERSPALAAGC
jgi:mannose-6-phosphate isomerase-like protein (cupin superfamily)